MRVNPIREIGGIIMLPSSIAHELTHAAVAKPFAERVNVTVDPFAADVGVDVEWGDGVTQRQVAFVALAPFLAGMLALGVAVTYWVAGGLTMPDSTVDLAKVAILSTWWLFYANPFPGDAAVAMGGGRES